MRILVTGAGGMLGHALVPVLETNHQVIRLTRKDCELCDEEATRESLEIQKPDIVMHLAAFTNVDACELDVPKAKACNEDATLNVAKAASRIGATVLYTSTDYVFDGQAERPYREDDLPNPRNVYGYSKFMGEKHLQAILERYFIVRTSWLFGPNGKNFVSTILRLADKNSELQVVNDQRGSPTYTRHLAVKLAELVMTRAYGIYHISGAGNCTWFEFAKKTVEVANLSGIQVKPISSMEYSSPARRPAYSVLANRRLNSLGIGLLPHWETGLESYLGEIRAGRNRIDESINKRSACSQVA